METVKKAAVNGRWLLFDQYKWTGSGTQSGTCACGIGTFYANCLRSSASKSASKTGDLTREELGLDWGWRHRNGFTVRPESLIWLLRQSGPKRGWIPASGTIFKRKHPENTSVCAIQRFLLNSCASKSASKRTWRAHGRPSEVRKNRER